MGLINKFLKKFFAPDQDDIAYMSLRNRVMAMSWQELKPEVDEILARQFAIVQGEIASKRPITVNPEWPESAQSYFADYPVSVFEYISSLSGESQFSLTKWDVVGEYLDEHESILLDRVTGEVVVAFYDPETEELLDMGTYPSIYHFARMEAFSVDLSAD